MPVITTLRLICSPVEEQDWPFYLSLQQDPDVMKFVANQRPIAVIREAFEPRLQHWSPGSDHWLCLIVRDAASQKPLGAIGYIHRENDCAEVGFLFAPEAQGQGYGYESLRALCDFAFEQGGIRRLTATVTAGNIASRRLLAKTGFVLEGELRESFWLSGGWHNDWVFGLLKHEHVAQTR
ncbi:GNAT family N-acetyltransferase [Lelliottia amnigena]|uniref:GNAT family N-acetyltransferase n=1 Tax=Lelliottia amnigena TaxID=61646 RepID=UPI001F279F87|nr:GNAT family protein [Lelliottia amnigena]UJD96507.1 GNAT family N-acetyltransferase [Lelliottia amnigena]